MGAGSGPGARGPVQAALRWGDLAWASAGSSGTRAIFPSVTVMVSARGLQDSRVLPRAWYLSFGPG